MSKLRVEALEQPDGTAFIFNNKNLLINGGMNIWQRGISATGISSTSTDGYLTADRWTTYNSSGGTWTQSQSTDVPSAQGFGYSLKMDCTTANTSLTTGNQLQITQKIEAQNLQHLLFGTSSPKSITLSFWVKSNKTGTYVINPVRTDGGLRMISKAYTINTSNTWEKKTITFGGDETNAIANDNGSGIDLNFWLVAGSNYTSGTLQQSWGSYTNANRAVGQVNLADSTSNEWYITGCQLEVGSTASGFEFEPFQTTLLKCHRYYRMYDRRATSLPYTHGVYYGMGQYYGTTTAVFPVFDTYVPYRDTPDLGYSAVSDIRVVASDDIGRNATAVSVYNDASHTHEAFISPTLNVTTSSVTNGRAARAFNTDPTNGFLEFDAEL